MTDISADCPDTGTPDYEHYLKDAAVALSNIVKSKSSKQVDRILIVSTAQERDFLGTPLAVALGEPNVRVFMASFWNKFRAGSPSSTPTNNVLAYHAEDFPTEVDLLISITLSAAEAASIADNFSRIASKTKADMSFILTVVSSPEERTSLIEEIGHRTSLRPVVIPLEDDRSLATPSKGSRALENHREHLVLTYGSMSQAYMPMSLGGPAPKFPAGIAPRNKSLRPGK